MSNIKLYLSQPYLCHYLQFQTARSQIISPLESVNTTLYTHLIDQNFRRSGLFIYRPHCLNCKACVAVRINIKEFKKNRVQRRIFKKHQSLIVESSTLYFSEEHYRLYQDYQRTRHAEYLPANEELKQYNQLLLQSNVKTKLHAFYQNQPHQKQLKMVCVTDYLQNGLSLVYAFFKCDEKSSYGIYNILWHIDLAHQLELPYLFLGYWIKGNQKTEYKRRFKGLEYLHNGQWQKEWAPDPQNKPIYLDEC